MLLWAFFLSPVTAKSQAADTADESWINEIRPDHPRLFFNADTWPHVKGRALGQEKEWFAQLKTMVDRYPENPTSQSAREDNADRGRADGSIETVRLPRPREWGTQAGRTAFVYLVTGDRKYLEKAKRMLIVSVEAYHECIDKGMAVDWYSTSRVHWLAGYDWIYNDLTPRERNALMGSFLKHIESVQPRPGRPPIHRLNESNHTTGFYGDANLLWFAGVAAHKDGIDDALALEFLRKGNRYNRDMLEYRGKCAGDDGGLASATTTYSIAHYPWSQFNYLYTYRSATDIDITLNCPYLAYFPVWVMWNWIPGPYPREYGSGDVYHYRNELWVYNLYTHMSQVMDFYGVSYPDCAGLAAHLRESLPETDRKYDWTWFFYPFLLTNIDKAPPPQKPLDTDLKARHFEALGQIFMRSGAGPNDTYSLFTIGSRVPSHKQFDENNFIIYKNGYLALDSGTRGQSTDYQLRHYYAQTVAHNCVLIHMPEEPFPSYWGMAYDGPEGKTNYGGMDKTNGGECVAFETNDVYTYIAGDATSCYNPEKCALALRQYVFIMPNHFVICDWVKSTKAEYKKSWLLHTQNEPLVEGGMFRADHEGGRLFCSTVYPRHATLTKIGGPGKEFWANGKNWDLAPAVSEMINSKYDGGLLGNWRMEVSPGTPRNEDVFIHLIQVGDSTLAAPDKGTLIEKGDVVGVEFTAGSKNVRVTFAVKDGPAGQIRISEKGRIIFDRDLTTRVAPQSRLSGGR